MKAAVRSSIGTHEKMKVSSSIILSDDTVSLANCKLSTGNLSGDSLQGKLSSRRKLLELLIKLRPTALSEHAWIIVAAISRK